MSSETASNGWELVEVRCSIWRSGVVKRMLRISKEEEDGEGRQR